MRFPETVAGRALAEVAERASVEVPGRLDAEEFRFEELLLLARLAEEEACWREPLAEAPEAVEDEREGLRELLLVLAAVFCEDEGVFLVEAVAAAERLEEPELLLDRAGAAVREVFADWEGRLLVWAVDWERFPEPDPLGRAAAPAERLELEPPELRFAVGEL